MMDEHMKELSALTDANRALILETESYLWRHPEIGYKEWNSSAYLERAFEALGYTVKRVGDIPGFTAELDTGRPGPTVAILGELDSLICATHPEADPETKAVHACGHHVQTTILLGCAAVLKQAKVAALLCGKVRFMAVPAEETIDLEYREQLVRQGTIHYVAGKVEFLYRGLFDGVDLAMMVHASDTPALFAVCPGCNGCLTKHFEYEGVAAHAGEEPHKGVNAMYAAALGLDACNALRETFREQDYVRFHPIITQAGVAANAIPNLAKLDAYVRAARFDTIVAVNRKINRALSASAAALGASLLIQDKPGNMPLHNDTALTELTREVIADLFGPGQVDTLPWKGSCTDLGDVSTLMPVIHAYGSGIEGTLHGEDFRVADKERACINPVKYLTGMVYRLLREDARAAREIIAAYRPVFNTRQDYFAAIDSVTLNQKTVVYQDDGSVELRFGG